MVATIKTIQGGARAVSRYFGLLDGVTDYYGANSYSEWLGKAASLLGLDGSVQRQAFENVLTGRDSGGRPLGKLTRNKRVPGYDITLSVPKSVSVLWAVGNEEIQQQVEKALLIAARRTMAELESDLPLARRGRGGKSEIHADLAIGMFLHKLSRANEPQLHAHCFIANACRGSDQQWSSVNSRKLHEYTMTLGGVFRGHLFEELQSRMTVTVRPGRHRNGSEGNWLEIAEISQSLIDRFSTRSKQIEACVESGKLADATARQHANFKTRTAKAEPKDLSGLRAEWKDEARKHGLDPQVLAKAIKPSQPAKSHRQRPEPEPPQENTASQEKASDKDLAQPKVSLPNRAPARPETPDALAPLSSPTKEAYEACFPEAAKRLAETRAYYSASEFTVAMGRLLQKRGVRVPNLMQRVRRDLQTHDDIVVLPDTRRPLFSSRSYFEKERSLLADAELLKSRRGARVDLPNAERFSWRVRSLTDEQSKAAFHLLTQSSGLKVIKAASGSGHEKTLKAVGDGFRRNGFTVVGAALSGKATSGLEKNTGIESRTLASWLYHLDRSELKKVTDVLRHEAKMIGRAVLGKRRWNRNEVQLPKNGVLVVDQAGMIDTHAMSRLLHHARKANCTVILSGDTEQLQPLGVGGPFQSLCQTAGYAELREHKRQERPADRFASESLREARPMDALQAYKDRGRFHVCETPVEDLVHTWAQSDALRKPQKHQILTPTRSLQDAVNKLCQAERKRSGRLTGLGIRHEQTRYYIGDRIRFRKRLFRAGITIGSFATVVDVNAITRRITVRLDEPPSDETRKRFGATQTPSISLIDLPAKSLDLAYASTTHSVHGGEAEHVWALIDGGHTSAQLAYSQISHGRKSTRLFAAKTDEAHELGRVAEDWSRSECKNLAHDMMVKPEYRIEH